MEKIEQNKVYSNLKVNGVNFENVIVKFTEHSWEFYENEKLVSDIPKDYINFVEIK